MRGSLMAVGLALACGVCGGGSVPRHGAMVPVAANVEGATPVAMLVSTTRQPADPAMMFDGERAQAVSYAAITISIPPDSARKVGEINWAASAPGDPRKDFVTTSAAVIDQKGFRSALAGAVKQTGRRKVLVFVHGFNNQFDEAVFRLAQIVHDAKSPSIPVLFTWPSRGTVGLRSYTYDRESANFSRDALEEMLDMLAADPNVAEINVLAHSMGNWVTLEALRGRSIRAQGLQRSRTDKLKNAVLVAPDVDIDVFRTQVQRMGAYRPRISVFVSQDDKALDVSKAIWGGVPRLGDIDPATEPYRSVFERDGITVFDLTKLRTASDNAHSRAFDHDIATVAGMLHERLNDETGAHRGSAQSVRASAKR